MGVFSQFYKMIKPVVRGEIWNFIDLESPVIGDPFTFVTKNNSLVTIIKFDGLSQIGGSEEFNNAKSRLSAFIRPTFKENGHTIQMTFDYDDEYTSHMASEILSGQRKTCERLGLDLDDIVDESQNTITDFCVYEGSHIALYTHLSALSSDIVREQTLDAKKATSKYFDLFTDIPNPFKYFRRLMTVHESFVSSFMDECKAAHLRVNKMDVHSAAREIRHQIEKDYCDHKWSPTLYGDKFVRRSNHDNTSLEDLGDSICPRLDWQLSASPHQPIEDGVFRVGATYYSSMFVNLFPAEIDSFTKLFNKIDKNIAYRISYTINHGRGVDVAVSSILNSFFSWAHGDNKLFGNSLNSGYDKDDTGEAIELSFQIVVTVMSKDLDKLRKSRASIVRAFQSYGNTDMIIDIVDPSEMHVTSAIGTCHKPAATTGYPNVADLIHMLPIVRPASFWEEGSIVFRTTDGKAWPWQPASSLQESSCDLLLAKPRQGKSVLSNAINTAICLRAGIQRLPWVAILDIGPSSSGFIQLFKDALPADQKHLAIHHKLAMRPEDAVNFLDLQLGCKKPLPIERQFILNMLTLMVTPPGHSSAKEDMDNLISALIDEVYAKFSAPKTARRFTLGVDPTVDKVLQSSIDFDSLINDPENDSTWYEIRDALFEAGHIQEAVRAQRYAVPFLSDLPGIAAGSATLERAYGSKSGRSENLIQDFSNKINAILRDYPIFQGATKIDFSNAKLVAIDLNDVAGGLTPDGVKRTGIMYMVGRYIAAKNFYLTPMYVSEFDSMYQPFQKKRISEIMEDQKRIVYDEFHRTKGCVPVQNQVELDQREGGKWGVQIALISHNITDFTEAMISKATNKFILGGANEKEIQDINKMFGLTQTEQNILRSNMLHGPKRGGSCLLYKFDIKDGSFSQVLRFAKGPKEIWAYSTTRDDMLIRQYLTDAVGAKSARSALAEAFPSGTATNEIEHRMQNRKESSNLLDLEAQQDSIVIQLAKEILADYRSAKRRAA